MHRLFIDSYKFTDQKVCLCFVYLIFIFLYFLHLRCFSFFFVAFALLVVRTCAVYAQNCITLLFFFLFRSRIRTLSLSFFFIVYYACNGEIVSLRVLESRIYDRDCASDRLLIK